MVDECLALRLVERRGSTALVASFWPFARFEARDLLILSVTRGLLQRSEKVAPHRMIRAISQAVRGCVKLPVMPRAVGCVAQPIKVMPRGVGCVRVTRSMMSRHARPNITSIAIPVVRTASAPPQAPIPPIAPITATLTAGPPSPTSRAAPTARARVPPPTPPADTPTPAPPPGPRAAAPVAPAPATVATAPAAVADGGWGGGYGGWGGGYGGCGGYGFASY